MSKHLLISSSNKSIAVLPFANMSADPENEYLRQQGLMNLRPASNARVYQPSQKVAPQHGTHSFELDTIEGILIVNVN